MQQVSALFSSRPVLLFYLGITQKVKKRYVSALFEGRNRHKMDTVERYNYSYPAINWLRQA
jgi:hypothetical protein